MKYIEKEKIIVDAKVSGDIKAEDITTHQNSNIKGTFKKTLLLSTLYFFMDYTVEVLVCSHDWGKRLIVGNLKNENFIDIWRNQKFNLARKKLYKSDRNFSPCDKCDVTGTFMGSEHAKQWQKLY